MILSSTAQNVKARGEREDAHPKQLSLSRQLLEIESMTSKEIRNGLYYLAFLHTNNQKSLKFKEMYLDKVFFSTRAPGRISRDR